MLILLPAKQDSKVQDYCRYSSKVRLGKDHQVPSSAPAIKSPPSCQAEFSRVRGGLAIWPLSTLARYFKPQFLLAEVSELLLLSMRWPKKYPFDTVADLFPPELSNTPYTSHASGRLVPCKLISRVSVRYYSVDRDHRDPCSVFGEVANQLEEGMLKHLFRTRLLLSCRRWRAFWDSDSPICKARFPRPHHLSSVSFCQASAVDPWWD